MKKEKKEKKEEGHEEHHKDQHEVPTPVLDAPHQSS